MYASSFTLNYYIVLINSVGIINCGVEISINKLHLYTAEETEAASEVPLDIFTDCFMKLRCQMHIYTTTL